MKNTLYFVMKHNENDILVKTNDCSLFEIVPVEVYNHTGLNFQVEKDNLKNLLQFCKSLEFTKNESDEIFMNGEEISYSVCDSFLKGYQKDVQFNLNKDELNIIKNIGLAVSTDPQRYYMQGVYFAENGDVVATDGRRLHCFKSNFTSFKNDIVSPDVFKTIKSDTCITRYIKIEADKTFVTWEVSDTKNTVFSRCIYGQFPNYKKVIPDFTSENQAFIENLELFKNYKKFTTQSNPIVFIHNNEVKSKLLNIKVGDVKISEPKEMVLNAQYLNDVYKMLGSKTNLYETGSKTLPDGHTSFTPFVFSNCNKDVFAVVMPMANY